MCNLCTTTASFKSQSCHSVWLQTIWVNSHMPCLVDITQVRLCKAKKEFSRLRTNQTTTSLVYEVGLLTPRTFSTVVNLFTTRSRPRLTQL
jgi:hypothetical protein